jgi:hypothetical protein
MYRQRLLNSSVVLMITGSTNNPNVNPPAKIESQILTYSQIMTFQSPNTMDGTPARLFVICLIIFLGQPLLHIHSCKLRLIHQQERHIILTKTKQSVPTIGKFPFGHSIFGIALMNSQLITQYP